VLVFFDLLVEAFLGGELACEFFLEHLLLGEEIVRNPLARIIYRDLRRL
jgi:hypothetical protein